jgi:hypothetical protein
MRAFSRNALLWRGNDLYLKGRRRPVAGIEPDAQWAGMWRVRRPGGSLSDMVNLSRARDAAVAVGLAVLNREETAKEGRIGASVREAA